MTITRIAARGAQATTDTPRERPAWTAILILLSIVVCLIAASFYVDAPVLDNSLVGP